MLGVVLFESLHNVLSSPPHDYYIATSVNKRYLIAVSVPHTVTGQCIFRLVTWEAKTRKSAMYDKTSAPEVVKYLCRDLHLPVSFCQLLSDDRSVCVVSRTYFSSFFFPGHIARGAESLLLVCYRRQITKYDAG